MYPTLTSRMEQWYATFHPNLPLCCNCLSYLHLMSNVADTKVKEVFLRETGDVLLRYV